MPELPEVETTVRNLKKKVLGRTFLDVWTDFKKLIKKPKNFDDFKKGIKGKRVEGIWRRGKNIIFDLSGNYSLLLHQKLTGHLLVGHYALDNECWKSKGKGPLSEKVNTYIHLMFVLDNGLMLALSDLRKFAKVELWERGELLNSKEFQELGPEPLEENFTLEKFKEIIKKKRGKIKQILMDQKVIAGIGNIYSDEILWRAKIHPFRKAEKLSKEEIKRIYEVMKEILTKAIEVGGESISDYRKPSGEKGGFDVFRKVYRKEGEECFRCGAIIKRIKFNSRSAHFCPKCQR